MSNARNLADIVTGNFDVPLAALDNVPASNDASALTTGTLPLARIGTGTASGLSIGAMQPPPPLRQPEGMVEVLLETAVQERLQSLLLQ